VKVFKHALTTECYNTHGNHLHLYFREVLTHQMSKGRIYKRWEQLFG